MKTKDRPDICAIITTYRPQYCLTESVNILISQVAEIIIIDDGASEENVERLGKWFYGMEKVTLWHQPTNSGIAAALNVGVNIANERGYEWVVTLDDDSIPDHDMVERLCEHLGQIGGPQPVGIIGMTRANKHCAAAPHRRTPSPAWLEKRGIITSGSLFSVRTFKALGPFREEFFIDSVDYDFCMKARARGYRVIQVQEHGFTHSLGQNERFKLGCFIIETVSHSPTRLYYDFRNSTILAKEYFLRDPLFACATALSQFKTITRIVFLQKYKKKKLRAIIRGVADAIKGKMGKIDTSDV